MKKQGQKYTVSFLDANRIKWEVEMEITFRNKCKEFTMSATGDGSTGQCQARIVPATDAQKTLLALNKFHLNGMSAGTPEQDKFLATKKQSKNDKRNRYEWAESVLKRARLFTVKYNGKKYQYGSGWIKMNLPKDIEAQIVKVIADVSAEEAKRTGARLKDLKDDNLLAIIEKQTSFSGIRDMELCASFVKMFDLCEDDLGDITIDGNNCRVQGTDYIAGTDEEMDRELDDYLDNYIDECILSNRDNDKTLERYFDRERFKKDAGNDGRGHNLNRYDGGEEYADVNRTTYYAYQQ